MDHLTRCYAGAGYDISASTANATPQGNNQQAGTTINFGAGARWGDMGGAQTVTPTANATAARNAGDLGNQGVVLPGQEWHAQIDWPMVAIVGVAVICFVAAMHHAGKGA